MLLRLMVSYCVCCDGFCGLLLHQLALRLTPPGASALRMKWEGATSLLQTISSTSTGGGGEAAALEHGGLSSKTDAF